MAAKITKFPDKCVTNLKSPTRGSGNHTMSTSWKVPASMTSEKRSGRAENLIVSWILSLGGDDSITLTKTYGTNKTSTSLNLNSFSVGSKSYSRSSFYPLTSKKLKSVTIMVYGKNLVGNGRPVSSTRKFLKPLEPTIDAISFNSSTGNCSTTVRTDAGEGYRERYDTKYRMTVKNTRTGTTTTVYDNSTTDATKALSYDASSYQSLSYSQYIQVKVTAYARGYAGKSDEVTRNLYISYPAKPTIKSVKVTSKRSAGRMTAYIKTNTTKEHPVDKVTLEYLTNVTYKNAADIPADSQLPTGVAWEDAGITDDGDCTALTMSVANLVPDAGKYTWIRVKASHLNEDVLYRYSTYTRLKDLETPAAETVASPMKILSAEAGKDSKSAIVQLAWNAANNDTYTGTELSWANSADMWKSTKAPNTYQFTWSDGSLTSGGTTYHDSAKITIKDLEEGEPVYIKARRYLDGDTVTYGRYSNTYSIIPTVEPEVDQTEDEQIASSCVANCAEEIAEGDPLQVYWSFSGDGLQKQWRIVKSNGTVIASGRGSITGTQISAKRLKQLASSNTITFNVQVSTGSGYIASENLTVVIRPKPTLSVTVSTLTAQPLSFTASSSRLCDLIVIVTSQGVSGQTPQGLNAQIDGDTIHSDVYSPAWSNGSASVTLPSGLDFWDGGDYTLSVTAVDRQTKLKSPTVERTFSVAWTNQAVDPDDFVTIIPLDYKNDGETHVQAVQIKLTAPTGSQSTDLYDIYRMDGNNAHLIGKGFPLSYTVLDEYAPFGDDVYYRIALRTVDGDVEFADKDYELVSDTIRIDWQDGTLELPYGNTITDGYRKNVEFRNHMDGSVDGYWNKNIERKGAYSSAIIKLIQPDEVNLARQLARFPGAVFVRTANGSAYTADVQVTDLTVKNEAITTIAIDATEVDITDEFMLPSPYEQAD